MEVEDQDHHQATEEYVDDSDEDDQPEMNDGRLEIEWETPENQAKTRARIQHVLNGCKCKQAALQRDASARGSYKDVDLDATV